MATVKDWIKVLIAALTGTLTTLVLTSMFSYPKNISNKFKTLDDDMIILEKETAKSIESAKRESFIYSEKLMKEHKEAEEIEREQIKLQYTQIQSDLTIIKKYLIDN